MNGTFQGVDVLILSICGVYTGNTWTSRYFASICTGDIPPLLSGGYTGDTWDITHMFFPMRAWTGASTECWVRILVLDIASAFPVSSIPTVLWRRLICCFWSFQAAPRNNISNEESCEDLLPLSFCYKLSRTQDLRHCLIGKTPRNPRQQSVLNRTLSRVDMR